MVLSKEVIKKAEIYQPFGYFECFNQPLIVLNALRLLNL